MNYKQKYEEALERAKAFKSPYCQNAVEQIFPELRESEDERIRKEIISFITDTRNWFPKEETKSSWIAWLEKQGEQKHTPKYKIGDCIKYRGEKYKITNVTIMDNNFYYDVSLIGTPSDLEEVVTSIGMAAEEQMFKIEQTSAWSEEDERLCSCLIKDQENALDDVRNDKYGHSEIISDLKEMYRERIEWLKSIKPQPHWKPSEEQMRVLRTAIKDYGVSHEKSVFESLYNDLEKL